MKFAAFDPNSFQTAQAALGIGIRACRFCTRSVVSSFVRPSEH
jgi:hypothetical protein